MIGPMYKSFLVRAYSDFVTMLMPGEYSFEAKIVQFPILVDKITISSRSRSIYLDLVEDE